MEVTTSVLEPVEVLESVEALNPVERVTVLPRTPAMYMKKSTIMFNHLLDLNKKIKSN